MKNTEQFNAYKDKESYSENPLDKAYNLIHKEEPKDLEDWQKAQRIVEVLGDENWLPADLSKGCLYNIVHSVQCPDDKTRIDIVSYAEEKSGDIFHELKGIDEVHMNQIEYAYDKWKKEQDNS